MATAGLSLVLLIPSLAVAVDIWTPHIANGPAPPPDQRPPLSRNATYDPSLLKYQIPAIIGSYVVVVAIIFICILTFGRRMRKEAQSGGQPISLEMVKVKSTLDPSPISPSGSSTMWKRFGTPRLDRKRSNASGKTKAPSVMSFDTAVIENDKLQREEEMSRIYGQVLDGRDQVIAPKMLNVSEQEIYEANYPNSPGLYEHGRTPSQRSFSRPHPPQRYPSQQSQSSAYDQLQQTQYTGSGMMPTYPPTEQQYAAHAMSPGLHGFYPQDMLATSPSVGPASARTNSVYPTTSPPPYSHSRQASSNSIKGRQGRTSSVRSLPISNPIPIPTVEDEIASQARVPKSPRYYKDSGRPPTAPDYTDQARPPTPPTARLANERPHTMIEDDSDSEYEEMREDVRRHETSPAQETDDFSDEEILTDDEDDNERHNNTTPESIIHAYGQPRTPRPPMPADSQQTLNDVMPGLGSPAGVAFPTPSGPPSRTTTPGMASIRSQTKTPPVLTVNPPSRTTTPGTTSASPVGASKPAPAKLAFRAIQPPLPSAGIPGLTSPGLPSAPNQVMSPGGSKTTFLSPKRANFLPGGLAPMSAFGLQPNTAALYSAGLATPYSPYMPMSPMTPVTPHLSTRRERREKEREKRRHAATEEDIVEDEAELWGDGFK